MPSELIQKEGFTLVNTAQLIGSVSVVTVKCPCKQIIMGQMGQSLICVSCKKVWFVSAKMNITIQEVIGDLTKEESNILFNG